MTWRMVIINEHSKLSYQNNNLIYKSSQLVEKIHISEIHTLMLETTDISLSTALICKLIENNVRIIFCDGKHNPAGEINPYYGSHDSSRKINQQITWEESIKQEVWTKIIRQKIVNQKIFLRKLGREDEAEKLVEYIDELELFDLTNREGHAAKVYFNALFGKGFSREDDNEINAFLNYGYTLILSVFNREIVKNGHLTQLGLKHTNYFNPYNLSSDLMEPFRIIIDEKVKGINTDSFSKNKHSLFQIFNELYPYNKKKMYLTNIIEHYVKKTLKALDKQSSEDIMEFKISEL
ncbi:MAG: type II CRISPR-associated endonuclease Cas1 [Eubacteriaceae bacterium]|nr:type II CRISPR-associated endonuclease Cas1 [Eubacteriaceae bacterium]